MFFNLKTQWNVIQDHSLLRKNFNFRECKIQIIRFHIDKFLFIIVFLLQKNNCQIGIHQFLNVYLFLSVLQLYLIIVNVVGSVIEICIFLYFCVVFIDNNNNNNNKSQFIFTTTVTKVIQNVSRGIKLWN